MNKDKTNMSDTTNKTWTRQSFEIEAILNLIPTYAGKDGINPSQAAQFMAQTLADDLARRGFFGEPNEAMEEMKNSGIVRYQPPRPRSRNQQMNQDAVVVEEQF